MGAFPGSDRRDGDVAARCLKEFNVFLPGHRHIMSKYRANTLVPADSDLLNDSVCF